MSMFKHEFKHLNNWHNLYIKKQQEQEGVRIMADFPLSTGPNVTLTQLLLQAFTWAPVLTGLMPAHSGYRVLQY